MSRVVAYCSSPTHSEDASRTFTSLIKRGEALELELHRVGELREPPGGTPNPDLLATLREVEALSVDALVRTHGLDIQAAQQDLRDAIAAATIGSSESA